MKYARTVMHYCCCIPQTSVLWRTFIVSVQKSAIKYDRSQAVIFCALFVFGWWSNQPDSHRTIWFGVVRCRSVRAQVYSRLYMSNLAQGNVERKRMYANSLIHKRIKILRFNLNLQTHKLLGGFWENFTKT